ncbi:MAG: DNA polymerase/3'-5' exonuclease PolX [Candidatus Latescibacteria bacterium]|nr:DNA polymerase/3'-5' exonuclease PolX [Candidatus Latescibacterota bacterium]
MDNTRISAILKEISILLELKGENPFKARAYQAAARSIAALQEPVAALVAQGRLSEVPGLGPALVEKVTELVMAGRMAYYDDLSASVPDGLLEMLAIPGLGAKKVRAIYDHLGITTIGELEYACLENRLATLEGFGQKTQEKILKGIEQLKRYRGHHLLSQALQDADALVQALRAHRSIGRVAVAGEVRRRMEVVRTIDLVAGTDQPDTVIAALRPLGEPSLTSAGTVTLILPSGIPACIRVVPDEEFAVALYYWTGSEAHRALVEERARVLGVTLDERSRDGVPIDGSEDAPVYRTLGLQFIPPELREGTDEVERAAHQMIPDLLTADDLRGVLHVHTVYSDGTHSVQEMADAARGLGYTYLAVCDHSRSAAYANGLSIERVRQQHREIDALNAHGRGLRILKGIETDILPDGNLDYPDDVLAEFDLVIASVHSRFTLSETEMTDRIVRAIRHPSTSILGHPTGRLLLAREGYPVDVRRVIHEAVEHGVILELNASPHRLDLDWRHLRYAQEHGAKISIGPDAHQARELQDVIYGVGIARKGWLSAKDVVNTMTADELLKFLRHKKSKTR